MSKFFQNIVDNNYFNEWAATLDWLVNDNKFDVQKGWNAGYIGSLTKKIKRMNGFGDKTYLHAPIKIWFSHQITPIPWRCFQMEIVNVKTSLDTYETE